MPSTANAKLNEQGEISADIGGIAVSVHAQSCTEDSPGIMLCNRSPVVEVTFPEPSRLHWSLRLCTWIVIPRSIMVR